MESSGKMEIVSVEDGSEWWEWDGKPNGSVRPGWAGWSHWGGGGGIANAKRSQ